MIFDRNKHTRRWMRSLLKAGLLASLVQGAAISAARADSCGSPDALRIGAVDKDFTQERYLSGVDQPLKSSGRLKISDGRIDWHMLVPFDVNTIITAQGISQSINGGDPAPAGDVAGLGPQLAQLFGDLLQGRWKALDSTFKVTEKPVPKGSPWAVSLETLDPMLKKAVNQINVAGCTEITGIEILHPNGDHERITFGGSPAAGGTASP